MAYNLTLVGSPSVSSTAASYSSTASAANFGNAISFNGSSQYATGATGASQFAAGTSWSVRGRIRTTYTAGLQVAICNGNIGGGSAATDNWWIGTDTGGILKASLTGFNSGTAFGTGSVGDGNWHEFELVVTSGTSAVIYCDGVAAGSQTGTWPGVGTATDFLVGVFASVSVAFYFAGQIDELALFTTAQHSGSYTPSTSPVSNTAANLRAVYHFDGNGDDSKTTSSTPSVCDRVDATDPINGQAIMLLVPNGTSAVPYNAANPTPVVMYCHGYGESESGLLDEAVKLTSVTAFLNAGYILCATNAHGNNFGNQSSLDDHAGLDKYVRANYNVQSVMLWGQSMGGLDALLILSQHKVTGVCGCLLTYPICSLAASEAGTGGFNFSTDIATAFSITGSGTSTYANKTYGHDPCLMAPQAFRNVPMRFYASASDTVVGKTQNTDTFQPIISSYCSESTVVACSGDHGDASHFQPSDYVSFAARCIAAGVPNDAYGSGGGGASFSRIFLGM